MPPLVTSLPWLSNQPDPVQTYQRSQALVQQMQAQQAQEAQAQAALAQRAQEAAMQAQFQQRALALKEQEAKSAVQVEADRLRQKGQALEFEQRQAEMQNQFLNRPPEAVEIPGMPTAISYRGRLAFPPGSGHAPDRLGQTIPVLVDPNDPTKGTRGDIVITGPQSGTFQPLKASPTPEERAAERAAVLEQRTLDTQRTRAESLDKQLLLKEQAALESRIKPGTAAYEDASEEERAAARASLGEVRERLNTYRSVPPKSSSSKSAKQVLAENRAALANQLEKENPEWNQGQIMVEVYRQIP